MKLVSGEQIHKKSGETRVHPKHKDFELSTKIVVHFSKSILNYIT